MIPVENLEALKVAAETDLSALLAIAGLAALDEYVYGGPTDTQKKSLGFYLGPGDKDAEMHRLKPVIQLQLYGTNYRTGLLYFQVIFEYLNSLDPITVGMTALERLSYTEFPPDESSTSIFTFYLEYNKMLDDCDS